MKGRWRHVMATNGSTVQANPCTAGISRRTALSRLAGGTATLVGTAGRDCAQAQATPPPREKGKAPNQFVLDGAETRITYDVTADAEGPRLTYHGPYGSQTVVGDMIRTEESALGQLVTGYLGAFPDQGDLWLTLLLPRFNPMTIEDGPAPFATLAILKWLGSTIAGPPRTGALEEYKVVTLEGTAQRVIS
jgi:hypothetical protein